MKDCALPSAPQAMKPLLLVLLAAAPTACPTPTPTPRARSTDERPQPRKPTRHYAKAPAPFVAILPGTKLYARPDTRTPYVQLGLNSSGKVPPLTCDRNTELPKAMRVLRQGHGWVEVETASSDGAVGACIERIDWSKQLRFRAWVQRADLGLVVLKTTTATYGVATATMKHTPTHKCLLKQVKTWRFPKPEGSKPEVNYPFHFKPSGC